MCSEFNGQVPVSEDLLYFLSGLNPSPSHDSRLPHLSLFSFSHFPSVSQSVRLSVIQMATDYYTRELIFKAQRRNKESLNGLRFSTHEAKARSLFFLIKKEDIEWERETSSLSRKYISYLFFCVLFVLLLCALTFCEFYKTGFFSAMCVRIVKSRP